ncbi:MAG: cytochrome c, partial [Pseudomonadales bacterium]|nr:cytochrome c [Pseudomonadales bacterium]
MEERRRYIQMAGCALLAIGALFAVLMARNTAIVPPVELSSFDASIEEGRYLATAGNCSTCHTAEGGDLYAGGVPFYTPFGVLYSTNITSHTTAGIGAWSFADFYASMKQGVRPDGTHLYPAFPYTDFAHLSDADIASLYLFMQTLNPSDASVPENELSFPFNQRPLLAGWKWLFHDA